MYTEVHHHKSLKPAVVHNICGPPTPRGEKQAWKCWSTADGKRTRLFSLRALSPDSDNFKKVPVSSEHLKDLFLSERIIYGRIPEPYVFFFLNSMLSYSQHRHIPAKLTFLLVYWWCGMTGYFLRCVRASLWEWVFPHRYSVVSHHFHHHKDLLVLIDRALNMWGKMHTHVRLHYNFIFEWKDQN